MPHSVCACLLLSLPSRLLVKDARWASGLAGLYYERIFPSVPALFSEENGVAEDILRFTRLQVRKLRIAAKHAFPHESALFQHARRGAMLVVAERIEAPDAQHTRRLDHRAERFGRIAAAPGVSGEHVPGHGAIGGFEEQAGAAQELSVLARTDQVRAGG